MARTKGTKNRDGHRAGGARKGAGRKRKTTEHPSEDEGSLDTNPDAGPSSIPDNYIDVDNIHPALKQYINVPHDIPLAVTPMFPSREAISESSASFRLSYAAWDSTTGGDNATQFNGTLSPMIHDPQRLTPPDASHFYPSLPSSLMTSSQRSASEFPRPDLVHTPVAQDVEDALNLSQEPYLRYEQEQPMETHVQVMQSPDTTTDAVATQPSSQTRWTTSRSRLIAPAPLSPHQRSWMFPYPLPAIMSSPIHRLAIVSQGSSSKRRRRRCAVCTQLGKEEASYDCPGRGDRSRCPFSRKRDEATGIPPKRRHKTERESKQDEASNLAGSKPAGHSEASTSLQSIPSAATQPSVFIPRGYVPLTPYGQPAQHFVLSSGETAKRRTRRCMVCVARGKDGTSCAGRGSRTWCPHYSEELDARTVKWPPPEVEQEDGGLTDLGLK